MAETHHTIHISTLHTNNLSIWIETGKQHSQTTVFNVAFLNMAVTEYVIKKLMWNNICSFNCRIKNTIFTYWFCWCLCVCSVCVFIEYALRASVHVTQDTCDCDVMLSSIRLRSVFKFSNSLLLREPVMFTVTSFTLHAHLRSKCYATLSLTFPLMFLFA